MDEHTHKNNVNNSRAHRPCRTVLVSGLTDRICGQGSKVFGHRRLIFEFLKKPSFRRFGVGHCFLRRERLGSNQEKRRFRVDFLQNLANVRAINV